MTVKDEIVAMMDYLGTDTFPQDGYKNFETYFDYAGDLKDGYDGYQVSLVYDKNEDTLTAYCFNYGFSFAPGAAWLIRLMHTSAQDPDPLAIDQDSADGTNIMTSIHRCLVAACRDKALNKCMNDELELASLDWCKC